MIAQYLDDAFAAGVAVQNQYLSSMSDILLGIGRNEPEQSAAAKEAVRTFNLSKVPPHQVELTKMQNTFMAILRELKQTTGSNLEPAKAATKEIIDKMMSELTKGQDALSPSVTLEQITDAIIHTVGSLELDPEKLAQFRSGVMVLFENLPMANDTHDQ